MDAGEDISDSDEDEDQDEEQDHPDSHVQSGNDPQASGQSESITKRRAQSTETGRYWSDHARLFYHPRSLVPIGGQLIAPMAGASSSSAVNDDGAQENDGRARFESWEMGHALFKEVERVCNAYTITAAHRLCTESLGPSLIPPRRNIRR